jgi:hypothetical protein
MFTIYMAGGGRPGTGGSIMTSYAVFAENVTLMDMKGKNNV